MSLRTAVRARCLLGLVLALTSLAACNDVAPSTSPSPAKQATLPAGQATTITGRVVDLSGGPVPGATVSALRASATTASDGAFSLGPFSPGLNVSGQTIFAYKNGYWGTLSPLIGTLGPSFEVTFRLASYLPLVDGVPLRGAIRSSDLGTLVDYDGWQTIPSSCNPCAMFSLASGGPSSRRTVTVSTTAAGTSALWLTAEEGWSSLMLSYQTSDSGTLTATVDASRPILGYLTLAVRPGQDAPFEIVTQLERP